MVALSGTQNGQRWRLAPSLVALMAELDRLFPDRDRRSDGSIGDAAHAARVSDHNPYDGWVHAVDIDEDLAPGLDARGFVDQLVSRRDPRVRYLIYEGHVVKSYTDAAGRPPWTWQPYAGSNAHSTHVHVSIIRTAAARDDLSPWWPQPDPGPPSQEDESMVQVIVNGHVWLLGLGAPISLGGLPDVHQQLTAQGVRIITGPSAGKFLERAKAAAG